MPPRPTARTRRKAVAANSVDDPLLKLRQLGSRVLQDGNIATFTQQELSAAEDELVQWIKKADSGGGNTPGVWAAVDVEGLPALFGLYALALRRSCAGLEPGVSETMRLAFASLRAKLGLELDRITADTGTHITLDRIRQLGAIALRSQTLQCHAALLAEAAALLAPPAGPQDPQASRPQQPPRRPRRVMQAASDALTEARQVLDMISEVIFRSFLAEDTEGCTVVAPVRHVAKEIVFHLTASGLLEHWSRLLLLLTACEGWEDKAAEHLRAFTYTLLSMDQELSRYTTSADWHHSMHDTLLTSPCLSYLLSSHVVGLCAALDGGPTYGMPAAGAAAEEGEPGAEGAAGVAVAPVFGATGRLRRRGPSEAASANLAKWVLTAWSRVITVVRKELQEATAKPDGASASSAAGGQGQSRPPPQPQSQAGSACLPKTMSLKALYLQARSAAAAQQLDPNVALGVSATLSKACDSAAAVPPLHTAAVFDLCMRLAEAATAKAAQRPAGARGRGGAAPRMAEAEAPKLAYWALTCGREALGADVRTAAALGPATAARLRRWWAAVVAVMDVEERHASAEGSEWRNLLLDTCLVAPPAVVGCEGLPDRPSPCVAAALDAGYLPRFARALRRLPTRTRCWSITSGELPDGAHYAWEQVLAFAPPREAAVLLRSVAALVQRAANAVPPGEDSADTFLLGHNLRKALHTATDVCERALLGFMSPAGSAATAGAVAPSADACAAAGAGGKAAEGGEGNGRRVAAPAPATMPRLGLALSCAASQLLPHVSQTLLCRHLVFIARFEMPHTKPLVKPMLAQLLSWAVLVAAALKRARDQEAAAAAAAVPAAAASGTPGAAETEAVPNSPPGASAAGSAAAEWRELLASLHLPTLLGTVAGVLHAGVERPGTEALVGPYRWALAGLLRFAPLEAAAALAPLFTSSDERVGRAVAESLADLDNSRSESVALLARDAHLTTALALAVAAEVESLTELRAVELADRYVGTFPGLDGLLDLAAFLVPPSKLESTLG